jgi:membrane protein required for colicin V production
LWWPGKQAASLQYIPVTIFDYVVIGVIGISVLLSVLRGFLREILVLVGWVAAFFVAKLFTLELAPLLPHAIPSDSLRVLSAFLILFLATLLVSGLLAIALGEVFKQVKLGWLDRMLGAFFGLARGVVAVSIIVLLCGLTSLPHEEGWRNAMFSAPLEALVVSALPWLPQDIAKHINYD